MKSLSHELELAKQEFATALKSIAHQTDIEAIRITFLGRKGTIAHLMEQLKDLPVEEKKIVGPALNQFKISAQEQLDALAAHLQQQEIAQKNSLEKNFDV